MSFVLSDWRVRMLWSSSLVYILSDCLYVRNIPLYGCMDRRSCYKGRQIKRGFLCGRTIILEKKSGCNWSVFPCSHTEEDSIRTDVKTFYLQDHTTQTPSLSSPPVLTTPPGTARLWTRYLLNGLILTHYFL